MRKATIWRIVQSRSTKHILPTIGMCFAISCWGGAYVAARALLAPPEAGFVSLSPIQLAALRFTLASCFFVVPFMRAIIRRQVSRRDLLVMALLGQLTFSLYYWLQYLGIQHTDAGIASILSLGLIPLFTALLASLFGTEVITRAIIVAFLLGFLGTVLITFEHPFAFVFHSGFLLGALCLVSNTFFFALSTHLSKRWMRTISPVVMTAGTMISGTLGLLLVSLLTPIDRHWNVITQLHKEQWFALLFLAIACSVLAYTAYNVALSKMDASRVTLYFYIEPLISILLGVVLLQEQITWQMALGAFAIGSSMVLIQSQNRRNIPQ